MVAGYAGRIGVDVSTLSARYAQSRTTRARRSRQQQPRRRVCSSCGWISDTMDLYSHVVPSLQRDAAREMGAALFGA
jgi:hypothetical protein